MEIKPKNAKLREIYLSLPRLNKKHIAIRNEIAAQCNVSMQTVYNWLQCLTVVPERHWQTIADILTMPVNNVFP